MIDDKIRLENKMIKTFLIFFCYLLLFNQTFGSNLPRIDEVKPANLLNHPAKASLTIQANVYFGNGDEELFPIAETEFYLLDENLMKILQKSNFKLEFSDKEHRKLKDEDYLEATARAFNSVDEEAGLISLLITQAISKHKIAQLKYIQ